MSKSDLKPHKERQKIFENFEKCTETEGEIEIVVEMERGMVEVGIRFVVGDLI